eukprot:474807_1
MNLIHLLSIGLLSSPISSIANHEGIIGQKKSMDLYERVPLKLLAIGSGNEKQVDNSIPTDVYWQFCDRYSCHDSDTYTLQGNAGCYISFILMLALYWFEKQMQISKSWIILYLAFDLIVFQHVKSEVSPKRRLLNTNQPTRSPTPFCALLNVSIANATATFDTNDFNGLYTFDALSTPYSRPSWKTADNKIIQYFSGTDWIIIGSSGLDFLTHATDTYFPPLDDITAEWYYSDPVELFHILITCIESFSPTTIPTSNPTLSPIPTQTPTHQPTSHTDQPSKVPTISPTFLTGSPTAQPSSSPSKYPTSSPTDAPTNIPTMTPTTSPTYDTISPTNSPTRAPTPLCLSMYVTVTDSNGKFDVSSFNGLYTFSDSKTKFNRPVWEGRENSNDKSIQYFAGSYWIINGIGDTNILSSYTSNKNFPPVDDTTVEWYHSDSIGTFHVSIKCIESFSPTILPTFAPSGSPTQRPTSPPTPQCPTIFINVTDENNLFDESQFNGLYTFSGYFNNQPKWDVPQYFNDKYMLFIGNTWIINGYNTYEVLSHKSEDNMFPFHAMWTHSSFLSVTFHVDINCIQSYSPTLSPTTSPTVLPTSLPTKFPTDKPTLIPSDAPTFTPTEHPSNSPTSIPTHTPTFPPTVSPSFTPTIPPSTAPTSSPTKVPSNAPTQPPTSAPTPQCPTVFVNITNGNGLFDTTDFNGLYTYEKWHNDRPKWFTPQLPHKTIFYSSSNWIIESSINDQLTHNVSDDLIPPMNSVWKHSSANITEYFQVLINCIESYAPITSPTVSPSTPPTNAPSISPTLTPSILPTDVPTTSPLKSPSQSPTVSPSNTPSLPPTNYPSEAPLQPPTSAPTVPPSISPTISPSESPTACIDYGYNNSFYSMDGYDDYLYDMNLSNEILQLQNEINSLPKHKVMKYIADEIIDYRKETIECNSEWSSYICFVGCYNKLYCDQTEISIL